MGPMSLLIMELSSNITKISQGLQMLKWGLL